MSTLLSSTGSLPINETKPEKTEGDFDELANDERWDFVEPSRGDLKLLETLGLKDVDNIEKPIERYVVVAKSYVWRREGKFTTCLPTDGLTFCLAKKPLTGETIKEFGRALGCWEIENNEETSGKLPKRENMSWPGENPGEAPPRMFFEASSFIIEIKFTRIFDQRIIHHLVNEAEGQREQREQREAAETAETAETAEAAVSIVALMKARGFEFPRLTLPLSSRECARARGSSRTQLT